MPDIEGSIESKLEQVKHCRRCGEDKDTSRFYKDKSKRDGFQSSCIPCRREVKGITKREKEKAEIRKKRDKEEALQREFNSVWRGLREAWTKSPIYKEWAKARHLEQCYQWDKDNPESLKARQKRWREKNPDKARESQKRWEEANKSYRSEYKKQNNKDRRYRIKDDPLEIIKKRSRDRIRSAMMMKNWKKWTKTQEFIGCDWPMLKAHIEKQFTKGMNWKNREKWQIDHIIPLSSARYKEDVMRLTHFSNLQPLWTEENQAKGAKMIDCQPELLLKH